MASTSAEQPSGRSSSSADGSRLGDRGRVGIDGCAELGAGHGTLGAGDAEPDERADRGAQVGPLVVVEVGHAQHGERRRRRA